MCNKWASCVAVAAHVAGQLGMPGRIRILRDRRSVNFPLLQIQPPVPLKSTCVLCSAYSTLRILVAVGGHWTALVHRVNILAMIDLIDDPHLTLTEARASKRSRTAKPSRETGTGQISFAIRDSGAPPPKQVYNEVIDSSHSSNKRTTILRLPWQQLYKPLVVSANSPFAACHHSPRLRSTVPSRPSSLRRRVSVRRSLPVRCPQPHRRMRGTTSSTRWRCSRKRTPSASMWTRRS